MDKQIISYCFTLSEKQVEHLRCKKYKIDRMECFMSLVTLAERETKLVQVSKTQQVEILPGQCMIDNTQLAKLWDKDRKTIPKLLEAMEALDISSSQRVGDNRILTLHSLSGWYMNGRFVKNAFGARPNADGSKYVHIDVPSTKVIITKSKETKNTDTEGTLPSKSCSDHANEGVSSLTGDSSSLTLSQSNDSDNVGKFGTDSNNSHTSSNSNSSQSGDILHSADSSSCSQGANVRQNEGTSSQ